MSIRRAGFTLIELLTVIAVLAVLSALLFPVFAQVREVARKATCLSHQRQLGAAVALYTQDYDERFPQTHPTASSSDFSTAEMILEAPWRTLMEPYIRSAGLYHCPSDWGAPKWHPSSYGPNGLTVYGAGLAQVAQPARTVYLAELEEGSLLDDFSPWYGEQALRKELATCRHRDGAVYLFVDGHVQWLPFERTWTPENLYRFAGG
jgi:prepilin-type N-terminal cleavage/methylation domain-containing protein/prepilin-type processing-associated H-X9-DG protein